LLVAESQQILAAQQVPEAPYAPDEVLVISRPVGATERQATVLVRLGQSFFRRAVLSSYEYSVAFAASTPHITDRESYQALVMSEQQRTDPQMDYVYVRCTIRLLTEV
jgi:hypothetical protein